jgi:flagellar motor switch protein FliG
MADLGLKPTIEFETMTGLEKTALLLNVLGTQVTSQVFKKMKDNDIKRIIGSMGLVQKASITVVRRVLEEFYSQIAEEEDIIFWNRWWQRLYSCNAG